MEDPFWRLLECPSAPDAVRRLNEMAALQDVAPFRNGRLVTGVTDPAAGPVWADVNDELYSPWIAYSEAHSLPFGQLHGHAAPWHAADDAYWAGTPPAVISRCAVLPADGRTVTTIGHESFVSINWASNQSDGERESRLYWLEGHVTS